MEFVDYARILRRRWRVLVATTLLGLVLALAYALLTAKTYSAQSKVYVHLATVSQSSAYQQSQYVLSQMPSYSELNGNPLVLKPVIRELGLNETVQSLAGRVSITNPAGTTYLDVDATASSFAEAKRVARAAGTELASVVSGLQTSTTSGRVVVARSQPATGSAAPVSPRVPLDLALGLVAGLALGAIWVLVRNSVDGTVRDVDELHRLTATVPLARIRADGPAGVQADGSQVDEYRSLRTGLAIVSGGHLPGSVVLVAVGCDDSPGVAESLAEVAAGSGVRTCLVHADLGRRATAEPAPERLELWTADDEPEAAVPASVPGLSDVLQDRAELSEAARTWPDSEVSLTVIAPGSPPDDPADLLDSPVMQRVHRVLRASFELVVYASSPTPEHPEAAILSRDVAATVLVVRIGHTSRADLAEVGERLSAVGAAVSGVVVVEPAPRRRLRGRGSARRGSGGDQAGSTRDAPSVAVPLSEPGGSVAVFEPPSRPFAQPVGPSSSRSSLPPRHADGAVSLLPPRARSSRSRRGYLSVEDETVEDETVEDESVEDHDVSGTGVLSRRVSVLDTRTDTSRSRTGRS